MTISLHWVQTERAVRSQLNVSKEKIFSSLRAQLLVSFGELREYIVATKLTGGMLHQRSGNLINATQPFFKEEGSIMEGGVAVGREAPYGRYQEYGAHIPERVPVRARALHWINAAGNDVFAMRARAFELPSRPFMRSSFAEQREKILRELGAAIARAVG